MGGFDFGLGGTKQICNGTSICAWVLALIFLVFGIGGLVVLLRYNSALIAYGWAVSALCCVTGTVLLFLGCAACWLRVT